MSEAYPDVEGALRSWLRTAIGSQRVFFGLPKQVTESSFPLVVITRVGGGDEAGDAAVDTATIQLDCWGSIDTASGYGKKATATTLKNSVRSALNDLANGADLTAAVRCLGAQVESDVWSPDPDDDRPRYVLTASVTAISL